MSTRIHDTATCPCEMCNWTNEIKREPFPLEHPLLRSLMEAVRQAERNTHNLTIEQINALPLRIVELADHELTGETELLQSCRTNAEEDVMVFELAHAIDMAIKQWFDEKRRQLR